MAQNIRNYLVHLCLLLVLLAASSCSTKKKKDSSFTSNFSTKYNILYNSNLLLQQAQKNMEESSNDNLQQLLPVFKEPNLNSMQQNIALMDSVMGKADKIITKKRDSKYIDQAFLLKGKASYYKGDYYNANEFFEYIRKNTEEQPSLRQEALLWQIRSLIQMDNLSGATTYLEEAIVNEAETKRLNDLLFATQAKYLLSKGNKDEALIQLTKAVEISKNKKDKRRWQYLLGQLLFEKGKHNLAYSYFNKVVKSNESYEVAFNASLYQIDILNKENPTLENRVKLLSNLLRDGKNKDYKGQIYQHIGDTYLADQQLEQAIQYYELANNNTVNNPFQQALNYRKLADLYFNQGEYSTSSLYYDSTLQVLPKENPIYDPLSRKQAHLESLVKQLTTISYQDSLIMLSSLSPEERETIIANMIKKGQKTNPSKTNKKLANNQIKSTENNHFIVPNEGNGSFYFSSSIAMSQGYLAFKKRWGNRPAGDNWRYSNRQANLSSLEPTVAILNDETEILENNTLNLHERYLQNFPNTSEKLHLAETTIKNAYLALADIYQNNLQDEETAIKTYETYLNRFPNDGNNALLYFHLYRLYADRSPDRSIFYKDKLIKEFPSSKYSLVINDPDYYKKQQDLVQKFNTDYNNAYHLFITRKYNELIQHANEIIESKKFNSLNSIAQLAYLRAIAIGRTSEINDFKSSLQTILSDYPEEELIVPLVNQHLAYIDTNETQFQNKEFALDDLDLDRIPFEKDFVLTPWPGLSYSKEYNLPATRRDYIVEQGKIDLTINGQTLQRKAILGNKIIDTGNLSIIGHENSYRDLKLFPDSANYLFVINVMHGSVNLSPSRYGIGQFNRGQYPTKKISHELKNISNENQLIYIGVFSTFAEVKAYEEKIKPLLSSIMKIPEDTYNGFIVTDVVFNTFANFDQIEDYNTFYQTQK